MIKNHQKPNEETNLHLIFDSVQPKIKITVIKIKRG